MMYNILKKLFEDHKYETKNLPNDILFSAKDSQEYYLSVQYNEKELVEFFESEKTNELIEQFERLQVSMDDIKKNTTLFAYVETKNIEEFYEEYKNTVFKIEEDGYFFRKHVIVYSQEGIKNINIRREISNEIHSILMKEGKIEEFEEIYYSDEEFFIAMQLMAKLPFLILKPRYEGYESLVDKINEQPEVIQVTKFIKWIDSQKNPNFFNQLKEEFLSEETETIQLDTFFEKFEGIKL